MKFLLLFGGFQGSGKTSVIEQIKKYLPLTVISTDRIRHRLFSSGMGYSPVFERELTNRKNSALEKALKKNKNIALDENFDPGEVEKMKSLLRKKYSSYRTLVIFLQAKKRVLSLRVKKRGPKEKTYLGKSEELNASYRMLGCGEMKAYDMIIDTEKHPPAKVAKSIENEIKRIAQKD